MSNKKIITFLDGATEKVAVFTPEAVAGDTFTFTVTVSPGGTFTLPLGTSGAFVQNFTVDWGDLSSSTITAYDDADKTHTYASGGTYTVVMDGACEYFGFDNGGDRLKIISLASFTGDMGFKTFNCYGCTNLASIVPFGTMAALTTAVNLFRACTSLGTIPAGLLDGCTGITSADQAFQQCPIASIPTDLFRYNTAITSFFSVFNQCTSLTSIPVDLFRYNVSAISMLSLFNLCSSLTSIPVDLLRYNILASNLGSVFQNCSSLTSVPVDLFRYNTAVTNLGNVFRNCTSLATVPADLFRYNTACVTFTNTFNGCTKLQQHTTIFCAAGEESTRFLNQSIGFTSCFSRTSFTGTQGTAPDLWNYNYGTGTPTTTTCWSGAGNSLTSLTNYADIPVAWK